MELNSHLLCYRNLGGPRVYRQFTNQLEETKEPLVLTVNGKAKLVVQDADAYQAMLDELERSRFIDA